MNLADLIPEHEGHYGVCFSACPGCAYVRALWDVADWLDRFPGVYGANLRVTLICELEAAGHKRPEGSEQ